MILSTATTQSRAVRLLADALSSIGHAEAQIALQTAIRARSNDEAALAMLVQALAMVETPGPAAEAALLDVAAKSPFATIRAAAELGLARWPINWRAPFRNGLIVSPGRWPNNCVPPPTTRLAVTCY